MLRGNKVRARTSASAWRPCSSERDWFSVPPGVYRGEINIGDEDALMCVMLGAPSR